MFWDNDPHDYQSCLDRAAICLSQIEHYETTGYPILAAACRREAARLQRVAQRLPKIPADVAIYPTHELALAR